MKTRTTVIVLLAVAAGVFAYTRPHNAIPSGLRDAVADSGESDSSMPAINQDGGNVPGAKTADSPGQSPNWKHVVFQAADKTGINIDYAIASYGAVPQDSDDVTICADPVWISVSNPALHGTEKIKVTIMDPTGWQPVDIDLEYIEDAGGKYFIGRSRQRIALLARYSNIEYSKKVKELAIAVNGSRLRDPVSGSYSFKFRMPSN